LGGSITAPLITEGEKGVLAILLKVSYIKGKPESVKEKRFKTVY